MESNRRRRIPRALAILALAGLAFRLCLPALVRRQVNRKLSALEGYDGHVRKVKLGVLRGKVLLEGLRVERTGADLPIPFFSADALAFNVEWGALLRGRIETNIYLGRPRINIVKGAEEGAFVTGPDESLATTMRGMTPFDINRLQIHDGEIRYRDFTSEPKVNLALTGIEVEARNLRNTESRSVLPASVEVTAKAFETGDLAVSVKAAPLKEYPTFELKQELTGVDLTKLNDFFDAYAKVRVKSGVFGLYAEAAAKEGKFIGYVKPFLKDVKIDQKAGGDVGKQMWAVVVSSVKWLFSNKRDNELATKIPIEGTFEKAKVGVWAAVGGVLKNAYIKALTPAMEGLDLKDVDKVKKP